MTAHHRLSVVLVLVALLASACSTTRQDDSASPGDASGEASGGTGGTAGSGDVLVGGQGSGGTGGDDSGGCDADTYVADLVPVHLLILLDRSGSMTNPVGAGAASDRWSAVTTALRDFVETPPAADVSVGLQFFPIAPIGPAPELPLSCDKDADCAPYSTCIDPPTVPYCAPISTEYSCVAEDYAQVPVPISPLPGVAAVIDPLIAMERPFGSSPMAPALEGAIDYLQKYADAFPDDVHAVVLASDGEPEGCANPNTVQRAGILAAEGLVSDPAIHTFVIGIGMLPALDLIASRGGTGVAFVADGVTTGEEFLARLNEIRDRLSCRYEVPSGPEPGIGDWLNFEYMPEGEEPFWVRNVASESECGNEFAWYYDDPENPTQIVLCPAGCERVRSEGGTVELMVGCPTLR